MDSIRKLVIENIKTICSLKGIRQVDIATHLDVSSGTVSNWFKGTNSMDIENLAELCKFLGVSMDVVFGYDPITPQTIFPVDEADLLYFYRHLADDDKELLRSLARRMAKEDEE